ncbi:MAG TPA: AraC family transcriptional regulator [Planctomycetota bacterium]|nr:AraC family transcriptional regulator [Planctomycetota bacterium]
MAVRARIEKILPPPASSFVWKTRREPAFGVYWHFHPEYQLTLVLRGKGMRFVGDDIGRFAAGDLVLTGPNLPHMWCSDRRRASPRDPHEAVIIQFPESVFGSSFLRLPEMAPVRRLLELSGRGIRFGASGRRAVALRIRRMERQRGLARLIGLLEILRRLAQSPGARALSSGGFRPSVAAVDRDRIDRICRLIADGAGRPLRLAQAAKADHRSVPAFTRFFRKCTGRSFVEYRTETRLGAACRMLLETDRSVAQVCRDAGFQSVANFNRRFRRLKGMSPREFRRQYSS